MSRVSGLDTGPRSFLHTTQPPLFVAGHQHADVATAACAMIGYNVPQTLHEEVLLEIERVKPLGQILWIRIEVIQM